MHIVVDPVPAAASSIGSQAWYFVGGAAGGPLVLATGVRGSI